MGNKVIRPAFHCQMNHHLVIGIIQHGPPACAEASFFASRAQTIQQTFDFLVSIRQQGLFAMQYFLVFGEQCIAQNENPSALAQ